MKRCCCIAMADGLVIEATAAVGEELVSKLQKLRHGFHQNPETAFAVVCHCATLAQYPVDASHLTLCHLVSLCVFFSSVCLHGFSSPRATAVQEETAAVIESFLQDVGGFAVSRLVDTAVIADIQGKGDPAQEGRCIALRSDMDALEMSEENAELPYRSQV